MIRLGQALLVLAAAGLWVASRLTWAKVTTFDGLTHPKVSALDGATWSTALVPLALLMLAAAVAVLGVRGWALRVLAILVAVASAGMGYLAISLWVVPDVAVRAAQLAEVSVIDLVDSQRYHWGAVITLLAAGCALVAAVVLMRAATQARPGATKYVVPAARRAAAQQEQPDADMSERMMWDALDEGADPTQDRPNSGNQGR